MFRNLLEMAVWGSVASITVLAVRPLVKRISNRIMCLLWAVVIFRFLCPFTIKGPVAIFGSVSMRAAIEKMQDMELSKERQEPEKALFENYVKARTEEENVLQNNVMDHDHMTSGKTVELRDPLGAFSASNIHKSFEITHSMQEKKVQETKTFDARTMAAHTMAIRAATSVKEWFQSILGRALILAFKVLWLFGALALLIVGARKYLKIKRNLAESILIESWHKYPVKISDCPGVPLSFGIFHPTIYVPGSFAETDKTENSISDQKRQLILWHEMMHLRHFDPLWKVLAYFMLVMHWWNPLVWVCVSCMNQDIEMACDEAVLAQVGSKQKKEYAKTLLEFAANQSGISIVAAFGESHAERRIKNALRYHKSPLWLTAMTFILVIGLGGCLVTRNYAETEADEGVTVEDQAAEITDRTVLTEIAEDKGDYSEYISDEFPLTDHFNYLVNGESGRDWLFTIDESGSNHINISCDEIDKIFQANGIVLPKDGFVEYKALGDDLVIVSRLGYKPGPKENTGFSTQSVYIVDLITKRITQLLNDETGRYCVFGCFPDYYNGMIYVTLCNGTKEVEFVYKRENDNFILVQDESNQPAYVQTAYDYTVNTYDPVYGIHQCSITRTMEEVGYLLGFSDDENKYIRIMPDGTVSDLKYMPSVPGNGSNHHVEIKAYDEQILVYGNGMSNERIYCMNMETGTCTDYSEGTYLDYAEGMLYFYRKGSIWQISAMTGEKQELFACNFVEASNWSGKRPGSGTEGFKVVNGKIYFITRQSGILKWVRADEDDGNTVFTDLGCYY